MFKLINRHYGSRFEDDTFEIVDSKFTAVVRVADGPKPIAIASVYRKRKLNVAKNLALYYIAQGYKKHHATYIYENFLQIAHSNKQYEMYALCVKRYFLRYAPTYVPPIHYERL